MAKDEFVSPCGENRENGKAFDLSAIRAGPGAVFEA